MRLISLTLNNFKGIKSFALKPQGKDINIYGDNATGKTTLADAFMWLLFDKDSQNRKDFQIKTLGQDGEPEHGLEHSVEAVLELENGKRITLKKVFKEKWTKKRGSATAEFTGHTTDHFIDGVPAKKKEYDEKIAEIADEQIFRLLTDPAYFNQQLHWQKRRELLLGNWTIVRSRMSLANSRSLARCTRSCLAVAPGLLCWQAIYIASFDSSSLNSTVTQTHPPPSAPLSGIHTASR
jgi:hypothetical protein